MIIVFVLFIVTVKPALATSMERPSVCKDHINMFPFNRDLHCTCTKGTCLYRPLYLSPSGGLSIQASPYSLFVLPRSLVFFFCLQPGKIKHRESGYCLDVAIGRIYKPQLMTNECNDSGTQRWEFRHYTKRMNH